jgi:hypothetical protein
VPEPNLPARAARAEAALGRHSGDDQNAMVVGLALVLVLGVGAAAGTLAWSRRDALSDGWRNI